MWSLSDNFQAERWKPRSILKSAVAAKEKKADEGAAKTAPSTLLRAVMEALKPFDEARRAAAEAMARTLGPYPGRPGLAGGWSP